MASESLKLELQTREITGKRVKTLRRAGIVPLAVCGQGVEPYSAQMDEREFMRVINQAGYTGLIELVMPGRPIQQAFLQELQRHPLSGRTLHADLKVVDVNQPVEVDVPLHAVGESEMAEKGQAVLNHNLTSVRVRALPMQIPHQFDVDISSLIDMDSAIRVRDLPVADGVEILADPDEMIFGLSPLRAAEEEEVETTEQVEGEAAEETETDDDDE